MRDEAREPLPSTGPQAALRLIAFLAILAGLIFLMQFLIDHGLRSIRTSGYGVSNRIMSGKVNADIVISGSSRALTHYDTRIISKVTGLSTFNIGRNGSQTDMQLAFLKAYLVHNEVPRVVIHNLDLFSFVMSKEIYDPGQYLPYINEAPLYQEISNIYKDAWKWRYIPIYGYVVQDMRLNWMRGLAALVGVQPSEDQFNGFLPRYSEWTGDFEEFRRQNPDGVKFEIQEKGVEVLSELARICRERGVLLVFSYSPVYWEMRQLERNREEIFERFREIGERYGSLLWDYSSSALCLNRNNFYNSQHLNANGAELFSEEIAHRLRKYLETTKGASATTPLSPVPTS